MAKTKPKKLPVYFVDIEFKAADIAKAGAAVKFKVKDRDGHLGTIEIGQGTFGWKGSNKQKFKRMPWATFAALVDG